jgi:uncharacterized FlgJ-related protein
LFITGTSLAQNDSLPQVERKKNVTTQTRYYKTPKLRAEEVKSYMDSIGMQHSVIVLKQALLETGHFKSKLLMDKNNLFAFRFTKKYMHFKTWQQSVDYYKNWQDKFYLNPNENYYAFLRRIRYAHAPNYISTLKRIKIQ